MCEENFQVEELRVINKDQEGQTLKLGNVTPKLTYIQEFKLGEAKPPQSNHLDTE